MDLSSFEGIFAAVKNFAGVGPGSGLAYDLEVMSLASYQAAPPRAGRIPKPDGAGKSTAKVGFSVVVIEPPTSLRN